MRVIAVLVALALGVALPAVDASAQAPGDEQYQDPFAGGEPEQRPEADARAPRPDAQRPAPAPSEPGENPAVVSPARAPAPATLPRTGVDAWLIALAGGGLVLVGAGLRRRLRDGRRA